jgi:hypothetical protein
MEATLKKNLRGRILIVSNNLLDSEQASTALANIISDIKVLEHLKDRGTLQMYHINKVRDALDKYDNLSGATPTIEYRLKLALLRNRVLLNTTT